jgi:calcium-dependent protein kinase
MSGYPPFMGSNNNTILSKIAHGKFSFKSVEWKLAPLELMVLIRKMLTYDP